MAETGRAGDNGSHQMLDEHQQAVIAICLPASMHALDTNGALMVAELLEARLKAGWREVEIRRALDKPLPDQVRRLSGLVAHRLREDVPLDHAPCVLAAKADQMRAERLRELEDAAALEPVEDDPVWEKALSLAKAENPDATGAQVARRAVELRAKLASATTADAAQGVAL